METIKVACGIGTVMSERWALGRCNAIMLITAQHSTAYCFARLLIYDALDARCRIVKLRGRVSTCPACGDIPTINSVADR